MQWWQATGQPEAQRDYLEDLGFSARDAENPEIVFIHDFEADLKAESLQHLPHQFPTPMEAPAPFQKWPAVPTHVIAAAADRLFPLEFMRGQALDRLGIVIDVIPGGHLAPLTQPSALVQLLIQYETGAQQRT